VASQSTLVSKMTPVGTEIRSTERHAYGKPREEHHRASDQ
jgi:hypothetical protein